MAGSVFLGLNFNLPFVVFDYKVAAVTLLIFLIFTCVRIQPITSISILLYFFVNTNHSLTHIIIFI